MGEACPACGGGPVGAIPSTVRCCRRCGDVWGIWFDRGGRPITMARWGALHADGPYPVVALDIVEGLIVVLTVWVGMDLVAGADHPNIFQTRCLPAEQGGLAGTRPLPGLPASDRPGEAAALACHDQVLAQVTHWAARVMADV